MDQIDSGGSGKPKNERAPAATEADAFQLGTSVEDGIDSVNFEHERFTDLPWDMRLAICRTSPRFFEQRAAHAVEELDKPEENVLVQQFLNSNDSIDREFAAREILALLPGSPLYFPAVDSTTPVAVISAKLRKVS